jgi:hypothetical protein
MKRFVKLGLNSKVVGGCAVEDAIAPDEVTGIEFLTKLTSYPFWKENFKDGSKRQKYAGVGFTYDEDNDVFIEPKPFPSWLLDSTQNWKPPTEYPDDGKDYVWNESNTEWVEVA